MLSFTVIALLQIGVLYLFIVVLPGWIRGASHGAGPFAAASILLRRFSGKVRVRPTAG